MASQLLQSVKQQFDLNIYEAKIWTSLLSRGVASAAELAEISKVPRSRCYDVLESLEKKGFIVMKIGKPIEYIAVKPDEVLERMKKEKENKAKEQIALVESVKSDDIFGELELLHSSGIKHVDISEISKSIVGRTAINKQVKQLMKDAKKSIMIVSDAHSTERSVKPLKSLMQSLRKKDVSVEVYGAYDKKIAKKLSGASYSEYKTDSNFVLIDGKEVVFLVSSSGVVPEYEVAIWMQSPFFVQALEMLFQMSVRKA